MAILVKAILSVLIMTILAKTVLSVLLAAPAVAGETCGFSKRPFQYSVVTFSNEITDLVSEQSGNHFAISPLSIWSLLYLVSKGAENKTLDTLKSVLQLPTASEECDTQLKDWKRQIFKNTKAVKFQTAQLMIVDERLELEMKFRRDITHSETAHIVVASKNCTETANNINAKVEKLTNGTIADAVTPDSLQDKPLVLMDILYFKGAWKRRFEKELTSVQNFYNSSRKVIGQVNMMVSDNKFRMKYVDELNARVLEIPYATRKSSMLIMLPSPDVGIKGLLKSLKKLESPKRIFDLGVKRELVVHLPRFKIEFNIKLEKVLSAMGLTDIFSNNANFSRISDLHISIGGFSQKTSVEVTEEGTVAAAVSTAEFEDRMGPASFTANSPFLYMIVDNVRRVPLVIGAYSKPSLY